MSDAMVIPAQPTGPCADPIPHVSAGPVNPDARSKDLDAARHWRRVLLMAYHYPPCSGSSGLLRTLCFSRDLREFGWTPLVLTAHSRAYPSTRNDQLGQIPADVPVRRAFALDSTRHLGIKKRYFGWTALPDPWVSWLLGAIPAGLQMIHEYRPAVLWSTYPIATAHLVGLILHRLTAVPWIADFRDPMTEVDPVTQQRFPTDERLWRVRQWLECRVLEHCSRAVFVTRGALRIYESRYPFRAARMSVIANGYDEENFLAAESVASKVSSASKPIVLLHSGVLYPGPDRDPSAFFTALSQLRQQGKICPASLSVRLRASGFESFYQKLILECGLQDMVRLEPAIPYQAALQEMMAADGLLIFQGRTSNPAIPAKFYEYLRARRPIFGLVDSEGDTAAALRQARVGTQVPLDAGDKIAQGLLEFLSQLQRGTALLPSAEEVARHSRKSKAEELAHLLDDIVAEGPVRKSQGMPKRVKS